MGILSVSIEVDEAVASLYDLALVLSHRLDVEMNLFCLAVLDDYAGMSVKSPSNAVRVFGT